MKFTKALCVAACILLCSFIFISCSKARFSDSVSCKSMTDTIKADILDNEDYGEYTEEDIQYLFDDKSLFDSCSIIYSKSTDDIGEVGILHMSNSTGSTELLSDAESYIKKLCEEKRTFLENYIPDELSKLDGAQAKQFGRYVVFTVLDSEQSRVVFDKIQEMLKG